MPHLRHRICMTLLEKKLKFQPVVALQGPRQTGKSFLLREILPKIVPNTTYLSFDDHSTKTFAETNPQNFLRQFDPSSLVVIDEAQKVPVIFDAIKLDVDNARHPGRYILAGSTEFSKKLKIRESLTGRITYLRVHPFTFREAIGDVESKKIQNLFASNKYDEIQRKNFLRHLDHGGMPGIFHVRSLHERQLLIQDWIETSVRRDLMLIQGVKLDAQLALSILEKIATLEEPSCRFISKSLRKDPRRIKTHLDALETLFIINKLSPHDLSTGQPLYFLCDVAFAKFFGCSFERAIYTQTYIELLVRHALTQDMRSKITFYRNTKGNLIHFILENPEKKASCIKILASEQYNKNDLKLLGSMKSKLDDPNLFALGTSKFKELDPPIEGVTWESATV